MATATPVTTSSHNNTNDDSNDKSNTNNNNITNINSNNDTNNNNDNNDKAFVWHWDTFKTGQYLGREKIGVETLVCLVRCFDLFVGC